MKFNIRRLSQKTIPLIIVSFVIIISIVSITFSSNVFELLSNNLNYKASLSAERQELYNKMKVDYVNVKERITGTAPWNSADSSNAEGIDISETDAYVRTHDVVKYTVELGISPNTDESGVTDASVFEGGVIKVKATLPNQGDLTLMTWEQDAWMQNVSYNSDKTEIYAEYHVSSGVSITNANQNLTFTIKVGGYKKEITDEMAPTFEVWMEGNQPDDSSSTASSVIASDTTRDNLIISGDYSFNAMIVSGINNSDKLNDVEGHYVGFAITLGLYQPHSEISDLRGVLYPQGKINLELSSSYYYKKATDSTWSMLDENNATGLLNGTSLIGYGKNTEPNDDYYPSSALNVKSAVCGAASLLNKKQCVQDTGNMELNLENNIITLSYDDYVINGIFPNYTQGNLTTKAYLDNEGYFASGQVELFVPYYVPDNAVSFDNQVQVSITKLSLEETDYEIDYADSVFNDGKTSDNIKTFSLIKRDGSLYYNLVTVNDKKVYKSSTYQSGDSNAMLDEEFYVRLYGYMSKGPYEGGIDDLITWNPNYFDIISNSQGTWYEIEQISNQGYPLQDTDLFKLYFGVYNASPDTGLTTTSEIESAKSDEFTWYETKEEALQNGKVTAILFEDPQNLGYNVQHSYFFRFKTVNNPDNIGTTSFFRHKAIVYGTEDRTSEIYYYYKNTTYLPSTYTDGTLTSTHSPFELGETVLITGVKAGIGITVTDVNASGSKKTAYDVQDGEINFQLSPTLSNGQTAKDDDKIIPEVLVTAVLPSGLSYKSGSANKEPESVTVNSDGTTNIVWKYTDWQVNHAAPDYSKITFAAEISASLENNASLEIKSIIYTEEDLREEAAFRTSKYGVIISNLAGSKAIKAIDKNIVEKNESFTVTSTIGNTSQESLLNIKVLEILPTNGDSNGSIFQGNYTIKVSSLDTNQKLYYTNDNINDIGITEDKYGKLTIKDVDLANDDRWIEVSTNGTIPSTATALASSITEISSKTDISYSIEVIPSNNDAGNNYAFTMNVTSDNLEAAIKTNTVVAKVVTRNIKGLAFIDSNRNDIYDTKDTLLSNNVVKLLDTNGNEVAKTTTDNSGTYIFENVDKGNYYVEFSIPTNYEVISKNGGEANVSNIANSTGKTDLLTGQNQASTQEVVNLENINLGIRKISSELTVKYLEADTNKELAEDKVSTVYYGDTYTTESSSSVPNNYELLKKTDNYTGIVSSKTIEVIYYYQKKDSSLETSISKDGPESITAKDEVVKYEIKYNAKVVDYIGTGTITIVDTLPYAIDEEKSSLDGGTYNADDKTIIWTEEWKDIDTYSSKDSKEITKNIELVYLGIEGTDRIMVNSIAGNIKLDNNERDIESQTSTDIKISGKIITHHYIKGTTDKLKDDVESTDLVGESFTSKALDIPGYIITKPETEEYVFTEEDQEVIYEYEKIKLKITTIVNGIGGTISGNEEVLYGDNSTKDYIVIKPDEGYVLGSVMINGVEVELSEEEKKQLILNNFENMTENLSIQVTFIKAPVVNPETGSFITFIVSLFIISFIICFYLYKNKKVNRFNKMI